MYHYVYKISNIKEQKYYYGKRSSVVEPKKDLGIKYFSSSKDKNFILDQRNNPKDYRYKVICAYSSSEQALQAEIRLHNKFNVGINPAFYNNGKQTATKFSTIGKVTVKDTEGTIFSVDCEDPRYTSGQLVGVNKGFKHTAEVCEIISKTHKGRKLTDEHKSNLSKARKGVPIKVSKKSLAALEENRHKSKTPEALAKTSKALKGRKLTDEHKERIRQSNIGIKKPCKLTKEQRIAHGRKIGKSADIYDYATNNLIAENVIIGQWAKENNYDAPQLSKTTRGDRNKPPSRKNVIKHKGIYAVYKE